MSATSQDLSDFEDTEYPCCPRAPHIPTITFSRRHQCVVAFPYDSKTAFAYLHYDADHEMQCFEPDKPSTRPLQSMPAMSLRVAAARGPCPSHWTHGLQTRVRWNSKTSLSSGRLVPVSCGELEKSTNEACRVATEDLREHGIRVVQYIGR